MSWETSAIILMDWGKDGAGFLGGEKNAGLAVATEVPTPNPVSQVLW